MRRILLSASWLFLLANISFAQSYLVKQWDHTYGGLENEVMTAIRETADKGFVIGGFTRSDSGATVSEHTRGGTDFWVINTDSAGNLRWDKRFGGILEDRLYSIDVGSHGSVILGGFTTTDSSDDVSQHTRGGMDYWIVKTDSLGNKLWDRRFGGLAYDRFTALVTCTDGGILAGGFTLSDTGGDVSQLTRGGEDFWIVKMDSLGNKQWDKRYGGDDTDDLWYIIQTNDGGFLLGGMTNSDSTGDVSQHSRGFSDAWVVKISSNGTKQWDRRFGGASGEGVSALAKSSDGGYIIYCSTTSDSTGDVTDHTRDTSMQAMDRGDVWLVKIDSLGNKQWDHVFGGKLADAASGNDAHGVITRTTDNGYFFGANSFSPAGADKHEGNFGRSQSWILKTDSTGHKLWDKTIYTNFEDEGSLQIQTRDGCYLVANNSHSNIGGYKTENSIGQNDYWIVKFCESEHPQLPTADFTVIDSSGLCAGGCFNLANNSLYAGVFQWYFPGGNPDSSTSPNPAPVCYSAPGTYDITLIAMNTDGNDTITIPGAITVFGLPNLSIQQNGDTLFVPQGFHYYQWYYNDTLILFDTTYFHIATQDGDYSIIVEDSNGCPAFDTLYQFTVGMTAMNNGAFIRVYPDPASHVVHVTGNREINEMEICDVTGRVILTRKNFRDQAIDLSAIRPGIYFVRAEIDGAIVAKKLIISR